MKRIFTLLPFMAFAILCTQSCDKENEKQSGPIVTLGADKGTFMVATLSGRVSGLDYVDFDFECGIEYSTDESFCDECSTRKKVDKNYTEDSYSITVSGIQPGKKYYYRAYYINQLLTCYGEVKTFTFEWTAPVVTTLSAELSVFDVVVLKGLVKDKGALVKDLNVYYPNDLYYGIQYSTTEVFDENSTTNLYPNRNTDNMENDSVICTMTRFNYGLTYYYRTFFGLGDIQNYGEVKKCKFEWDGYKMVDLGLSVKWATCNVGTTFSWDYGDYFAWGETEPKEEYNRSGYKYGGWSLKKYNINGSYGIVDNKTTLDPEDDVAHVKWGGNWRMPTQEELVELNNNDNCIWTWTTLNGVNGYLVTSKKIGYEGASIFLPAAGYRDDGNFRGGIRDDGGFGCYWSSSLGTDAPFSAWDLSFNGSNRYMGAKRYLGRTVRPVCP